MATRRQFSREFKFEAVRLVKERGVALAQAARDLDLHETVLRSWIRAMATEDQQITQDRGRHAGCAEPPESALFEGTPARGLRTHQRTGNPLRVIDAHAVLRQRLSQLEQHLVVPALDSCSQQPAGAPVLHGPMLAE